MEKLEGLNMKHNPEKHHRRSIRLKGRDYSLFSTSRVCCDDLYKE